MAPAPRGTHTTEGFIISHHISIVTKKLTDTRQQVHQLRESLTTVSQSNYRLINEVMTLRKMLNVLKHSHHEMLAYISPTSHHNQEAICLEVAESNLDSSVCLAPTLRRKIELLSSVVPNHIADHGVVASVPVTQDQMNGVKRYLINPVGQTVGNNLYHSSHIHNPYTISNDSTASVIPHASQCINTQNQLNFNPSNIQ